MKQINTFDFYEFGKAMRMLAGVRGEVQLNHAYYPLTHASRWLGRLLSGDVIELTFCAEDAAELRGYVDGLVKAHYHGADGKIDYDKDWNVKINEWELSGIQSMLEKFEHTLAAESRRAATYFVPRKGVYDTIQLINSPEGRVPTVLRAHMNELAVSDYQSSAKCLALQLTTAAGYHAARAVEGVLSDYYQAFAGKGQKPATVSTMNDYLVALESMQQSAIGRLPNKKTLRSLRDVKDLDRNPLMHPRAVLDAVDAEILFDLATASILSMTKEMEEISPANQPGLPFTVAAAE